jgi:hypothetical protein
VAGYGLGGFWWLGSGEEANVMGEPENGREELSPEEIADMSYEAHCRECERAAMGLLRERERKARKRNVSRETKRADAD